MPESNDKNYEQAMSDILAIYAQAEKEMLEKVAKRVAKGIKSEGWNETNLKDTQALNKELAELMAKANKQGQKKIAVEVAKGYLKSKHITYKDTAELIKSQGFKIGNGKVSGNTWGKAGYFTNNDEVLDFYGGLMTQGKKNKGKETEVIEQYIKLGKTKKIVLNYDKDADALIGTKDKDMMYIEAAKQLDDDAKKYFFENLEEIKKKVKYYNLYDKETGEKVKSVLGEPSPSEKEKYVVKPDFYSGTVSDDVKKLFNDTVKKYKYDTLQIESNNNYVGFDQTVVLNNKGFVSKDEAEEVVEKALEGMSYEQLLEEAPIPMNLKQLVKATNGLIENASFKILRNANDAYQKIMANATTGLLAGVDTRRQATQKMLNEFAAKGITSFVDKAGRNWNLSSYAEMCARTVSQNAARQGHFDRQVEVGEDLVKVSKIGTTCPICQRWQGVVLSISGNHPKYHSVDEAKASGLFHPNCKHIFNLYVEELDGPGKVEPDPYNPNTQSSKKYYQIQKQRAHERNIRYWKKRKALAISPEEEKKADENVKKWQYKNLIHCEKYGLRRDYAREGVMVGNATGPMGALTGGSLKEYEEVYKNVIGEQPKKVFKGLKMNLQLFAEKKYEKWLKEEIQSLDELDVDKAMMKDVNNKNVTPTSLYKKYIGDNPAQDYAAVSEYEKGTKEYKTGYAKWLKQQIDEIGVSYKVKPKYVEVHEDIPEEDKSLSATEIYKKYHDGEKPTEAYKNLGGEEGTGMKYSKWVETQKKELIKNGITKTVPFGNSVTQKTADVISDATDVINKTKETLKKDKLDKYKAELDKTVLGQYDGYLAVKKAMDNDDGSELSKEMIKVAQEKHLEMVKKKALKQFGSQSFKDTWLSLIDMKVVEADPVMKAHIQNQIDVYKGVEAEEEEKKKAAEEAKKKSEEEAKKKAAAASKSVTGKSNKVTLGREVRFDTGVPLEREQMYNEVSLEDLENLSSQVRGHSLFENSNRRDILGRDRKDGHNHHMGHDVRIKKRLSKEDQELAEAFALAYDEYFNTIKCQSINLAYLNGYENATPEMKKKIDAINKCIQSVELNEPIKTYRFVDQNIVEAIFKTSDVKSLRPGSLYENATFMSTATGGHPTFGKRPYMLTLQCDKGTHALPTLNHEEMEVLLGKGKFEFVRTEAHGKDGKPGKRMKNYDGSYMEFKGDEIVVRYIEDGKAQNYEKPTPELIDKYLKRQVSGEETHDHHTQDEHKQWLDDITPREKSAARKYTSNYYTTMNSILRKRQYGTGYDDTADKYIKDTQAALSKASLDKPIVLRRGIDVSGLSHLLGGDGSRDWIEKHIDKINQGDYACEDKAFLSTSPDSDGGFNKSVEVRMYCPTGTRAAYVAPFSVYSNEEETLLQSGSISRVVKLEKKGSGYVAYMELLGTD